MSHMSELDIARHNGELDDLMTEINQQRGAQTMIKHDKDRPYLITGSYIGLRRESFHMATRLGAEHRAVRMLSEGYERIRFYKIQEDGSKQRIDLVSGVVGLDERTPQ